MDKLDEMVRTLGRIEGQVQYIVQLIPKIVDRISELERWQYWLKGARAALMVAAACLCKLVLIK